MSGGHFCLVLVRDSLGWLRIPSSFEDFQASFLGEPGAKNNRTYIFLFAGVSWALWRTRNDWVFSDILVRHPKHIAHRTFGFLQQWRALSTKEAKKKVEDLLTKLHVKLQAL